MSADEKKHLAEIFNWTFKGILSVAACLICYIFITMKEDVRFELNRVNDGMIDIRADMKIQTRELKGVSDIVIRLGERVERNKENIERLDRQKADRR